MLREKIWDVKMFFTVSMLGDPSSKPSSDFFVDSTAGDHDYYT